MYSYEFKKEVIKYVLKVDSSFYHAQKKFNVNRKSIIRKLYEPDKYEEIKEIIKMIYNKNKDRFL